MSRMPITPPICVALDHASLDDALRIVDALDGAVPVFKVGLELFAAEGPRAVEVIRSRGSEVFLDLKINDIPNQAAGAVRSVAAMGAAFVTVHGNAGRATVSAAVDAVGEGGLRILVVSVLTSLDATALREIGVARSMSEQVQDMADLAVELGAGGLVLSAKEVVRVRAKHPDLFLVTPGIRPASADTGDQKRVGTPAAAVTAGADLLVIGRPVTAAPDPRVALGAIIAEIDEAKGRTVRAGA